MAEPRPIELVEAARQAGLYELLRMRLVKTVIPAVPAAGANINQQVPPGCAWELLAFTFRFSTSAVVANRQVVAVLKDELGNLLGQLASARTHVASSNLAYSWSAGLGFEQTSGAVSEGLPSPAAIMTERGSLSTTVVNLDAGDQFLTPVAFVREWSLDGVNAAARWIAQRQAK